METIWFCLACPRIAVYLDWYTSLVGIAALLLLSLHGALWVNLKGLGAVKRTRRLALALYWPAFGAVLSAGIASFSVQPLLADQFSRYPELWLFTVLAASGLLGIGFCMASRWNLGSFFCSGVLIVGLLCSFGLGFYPVSTAPSGAAIQAATVAAPTRIAR